MKQRRTLLAGILSLVATAVTYALASTPTSSTSFAFMVRGAGGGGATCTGVCYYVSPTGSDSNAGTSTGSPWQTITKVNSHSYAAGSSIVFQAGGTWTGELIPPSSGTSGSPITFGFYGSGAQPIISGSGTGNYVIYLNNVSYVTINGLNIINGSQQYGIYVAGGTGVTFTNNTIQNNTGQGLRLDDPVAPTLISGNTFANNGHAGVEFYDASGIQIINNIVHDNVQDYDYSYEAGIKGDGSSTANAVISGNLVYNNGLVPGSSDTATGAGIWIDTIGTGNVIEYNLIYNNNFGGINDDATSGTIIFANVIYNNAQAGIIAYADGQPQLANTLIYGNTVVANIGAGIELLGPSSGATTNGCINNIVKNNIVVNTVGTGEVGAGNGRNLMAYLGCDNPGTNGSGNVYTYNNFGASGANIVAWSGSFGSQTNYTSYSAWEAATGNCGSTGCSHSVQSAPTFTNAGANIYTLLSGDPDIDVGVNLGTSYQLGLNPTSAWPASITTLNQNSYGTGWEVGAFVFP